ncbi:MAG TPA: multidrug transporter, partial [Desulfobulbaceae bacterium]|nr:multidrug transporter [Desulfobulbaceae bacterium]
MREARAEWVIAAATGSVSGSAEAGHSRRSDNGSSSGGNQDLFQIGFDAVWELDIFGGVRRAVESADATLAASEEELRDVLVSLQAEVARNYLELRGSQKRLATTRKNIATQERTVEVVRGRYEMGLGNELDLVQAETQLALTRATVPALEASARQSMHQLALLLGQNPASLIEELSQVAAVPLAPARIPVDLPSELLRKRPDLRAVERRLAAATA